jgi:hypothetical protein
MSDFSDNRPLATFRPTEEQKKEQARLRKKHGWDENGKRVAPAKPERETAETAA